MARDLIVLGLVLYLGFLYYKFSTSRVKDTKNMAFIIKMVLLVISFILAFTESDYIRVGESFELGGRSSVMMLIIVEIVDAFIDKKTKK